MYNEDIYQISSILDSWMNKSSSNGLPVFIIIKKKRVISHLFVVIFNYDYSMLTESDEKTE